MVRSLDHKAILEILPDRKPWTHKGDYGKILLLCGCRGCTGAAALAAWGALRCGAGLVYLAVPESIYAIEAVKVTEPVVIPLPDQDGMFSKGAISWLEGHLGGMDAVLVGPGIGRSAGSEAITKYVLETFPGPVIVDADGINVLSQHKDVLRRRKGKTVLTPHDGEFVRLGGKLQPDRLASAAELADALGVIVLLKGFRTMITDGRTHYQNCTGNPGMAVGGSGDVLAGMIVGLIGQGIEPLEATACAAWLHGKAGDLCAETIGQYAMLPTDMLSMLPRLLK